MPPNGKIKRWAKRKRGSPKQIGQPFPVFQPTTIQTSGRGFKEQLRTKARHVKKPPFLSKNPLTEPKEGPTNPFGQIKSAVEEPSRNDEIREQVAEKILAYLQAHPDTTLEDAEIEVTGAPVERTKTTTQKIKDSLAKIFSTLGIGQEKKEEENAYVYVDRDQSD